MDSEISDLLFIGEKEISVCGITLYEYTIREIFKMGKSDFRNIVYFACMKPIDLFKRSQVTKGDFENISMYDIIPKCGEKIMFACTNMLNLVTRKKWSYNINTNNFESVDFSCNPPKIYRIDKNSYKEITEAICAMFCVHRTDPYEKYGDYDKAEDFVKEIIDQEVEKDCNETPTVTISSIVEGVSCHRDSGFNANTIGDITIYQLFRIYARIQQKTSFDNHMRAIYSGCMSKDSKIDIDDISWVKNLDI